MLFDESWMARVPLHAADGDRYQACADGACEVIVTALRRACGVVLAVASTARPIPADVTTRDVEILTDDGAKIELYPSLTTTAHPCGL